MEIFLVLIIAAVLAIQIVEESVLALHIKRWLGLAPYPVKFEVLSYLKNWWELLGVTRSIIFMPIILVLYVMVNIHQFFAKMLECSVCTAYHISFWLLFLYMELSIIQSILYAFLSIVFVYLLNNLRK